MEITTESLLKGFAKEGQNETNFDLFYMNSNKGVITYFY